MLTALTSAGAAFGEPFIETAKRLVGALAAVYDAAHLVIQLGARHKTVQKNHVAREERGDSIETPRGRQSWRANPNYTCSG